jgi:hypothetical protein
VHRAPPGLAQGERRGSQGFLNIATETVRGLPRPGGPGNQALPCYTHLRPIAASPASICGLVGGGVKGLPGRGLREAGLE